MNSTPHSQLVEMAKKAGAIAKERKLKRKEKYNLNPKKCRCCGAPISYEKRKNNFCNSSCAATYHNTGRNKRYSIEERKQLQDQIDNKYCKNCGKKLIFTKTCTIKDFLKRECCSQKCYNELRQKTYIDKWKNGEESGTNKYSNDTHPRVRQYMLDKAENKCEICGWHEVNPTTGKVPLQVHHVDGDCTNNKEDNLQVLCPNCHSLTPTFGAQNKGSGRFNRLKYKTKEYLKNSVKD